MDPTAAYEAIVAAGDRPEIRATTLTLRRAFEARTGAFGPEDAWFEARSRAFWDDAVTTQRFAGRVKDLLDEEARAWILPLERAHRGLFRAEREGFGGWRLDDVWSGASFFVTDPGEGLHEALEAASLFDGRVVAHDEPFAAVLLPGAVFHPEDATGPIEAVIEGARARGLEGPAALDALLRMERNLRARSRVKAAHAYRLEALESSASEGAAALRRTS